MEDTQAPDNESEYCKRSDTDTVFVTANFEPPEYKAFNVGTIADKNSMMRFEFVEGVLRAAVQKFIKDKKVTQSVAEAVQMLGEHHISKLAPESDVDPNEFRMRRLYVEEVDLTLK